MYLDNYQAILGVANRKLNVNSDSSKAQLVNADFAKAFSFVLVVCIYINDFQATFPIIINIYAYDNLVYRFTSKNLNGLNLLSDLISLTAPRKKKMARFIQYHQNHTGNITSILRRVYIVTKNDQPL